MYRYLFLTMFSFVSLVEGSFRSQREHGASEDVARAHPGFGAAVLVVQYGRDFKDVSISNGIYIAPGKVLTHSHERFEIGKTYVVSPFAGFKKFSCDVDMTIEGDSYVCSTKYNLNKLGGEHCRKVKSVVFPAGRTEIADSPVRRVLDPNNPQSLEFVANYEGYVGSVVSAPAPIIRNEGRAVMGADFCILDIKPFKESHPTAELYSDVTAKTAATFPVTVLGYSFKTHVFDGSDYLLGNTMNEVFFQCKAQKLRVAELEIEMCPRVTSFSQLVRPIGDNLVAEAVCGVTSAKTASISGDEIFDKERTNPAVQAVIVKGLSGSGVYVGSKLIGIVSTSHKCNLTEFIESELGKAKLAGDIAKVTAFTAMHPSTIPHPLLNIHQYVTAGDVDALLRPSVASVVPVETLTTPAIASVEGVAAVDFS
jgi:hypothetical protein